MKAVAEVSVRRVEGFAGVRVGGVPSPERVQLVDELVVVVLLQARDVVVVGPVALGEQRRDRRGRDDGHEPIEPIGDRAERRGEHARVLAAVPPRGSVVLVWSSARHVREVDALEAHAAVPLDALGGRRRGGEVAPARAPTRDIARNGLARAGDGEHGSARKSDERPVRGRATAFQGAHARFWRETETFQETLSGVTTTSPCTP